MKNKFLKFGNKVFERLPVFIQCKIQQIIFGGKIDCGEGSFIHSSCHLIGRSNISIGSNSCLSEGCWLNVNHRNHNVYSIIVGNNCFIGKNNFITSGAEILICDYTLTAFGCKLIGSSHATNDPLIPYMVAGATNGQKIRIGVNCFIGSGSSVIGNVKIGHGSVIGAESVVLKDVPPFSLVVGNPAKIIKRYSFNKGLWVSIDEFSFEDNLKLLSEDKYLSMIRLKHPKIRMPFIAAGKSMGDL
jgi:acetyltransferase-like isoleucine patch superfamily enzyme